MMKKIFVVLLLLVSGFVMAQPSNYVPYQSRNRYIALMADSTFHIPRFNGSPSLRTGGSSQDGALAADTANGRLYMYYNGSWGLVNKDTANTFLNSLYKKTGTDSIFQIKGGTHSFVFTVGSGSGSSSDSSTLFVDTTYNRLAHYISQDTLLLKSLRVRINGYASNTTETDSTIDININQFDAETPGVVPPSTGTTTDFLRADGTWAEPAGGGGGDTVAYSYNPADWLVSLHHKTLPYFYTSGVAGDPSGSYYETSQYTPAPVKITAGTNKGKLFVATKGDFHRAIFGWVSSDNGLTWDTVGQIVTKSATGWDKSGASMPHLLYDSATNTIHMWYMGFTDSTFPSKFGVGYATASGNSYNSWTKHGEVFSSSSAQSQFGLPHHPGYLKVSSVVKGRETGKYYFHGCYWVGNASAWSDSTMRLWQGVSSTINGTIDSAQQILAPVSPNTLLENPTVYYGDDGNYWMIYTNGFTDLNGGIDSVQYLQTAKTASLKNPNWVKQPGIVFYPTRDSTWMGKRVYNAQLLKNRFDYYDRPISIRYDSAGRDVDNIYESYWMLFYSASYPNSYHDQGSILRILPQRQSQNTYAIGFNGDMPNILQKNGSAMINIPMVDSLRRNGWISWRDYRTFHNKVKLGTAGTLAYYDSNMARVRDLLPVRVTTGTYPTMTLGASGYSSFTLNFRNTAGTTGSISEDGGMIYRASSSYKKHVFYDNITSPVMLANLYSSGGIAYAYFPGLTNFGSSGTAVSNLETSGSFGATIPAAKTANYTATASDYTILTDATSGAITITLPQASICGN